MSNSTEQITDEMDSISPEQRQKIVSDALRRRKNSRRSRVKWKDKVFVITRPKPYQIHEMVSTGKDKQMDVFERFVIGWEGFTALDLYPGGDNTKIPFDTELFIDWVEDNPDCWAALTKAITEASENYQKKIKQTKKK